MNTYREICDINDKVKDNDIIQGKIIRKSNLFETKQKTHYFWCIITDKEDEIQHKKKEPNQIKIMFWHPYSNVFHQTLKIGKIYDFNKIHVRKTNRRYHNHSYQLTVGRKTTIKNKKFLTIMKNGVLCNQSSNKLDKNLQINIKHYFKKL